MAGADVLRVLRGHVARDQTSRVPALGYEVSIAQGIYHQSLEAPGCGGGTESGFYGWDWDRSRGGMG